jgi:alkylation response protein AidB-like acyl-CoA dehydrogenase
MPKELCARLATAGAAGLPGTVVTVEVLGDLADAPAVLDWLIDHATVGLRALELGIVEQVLRMTATYTSQRVQFDRPIATFQAVAQRAAEAYIHGGLGYDLEYPLARYYPISKQIELTLGGATAQLARMGALMAAE